MNLHRRVAALEERLWVRIASEETAREAEAQWNRTCAEDPELASIVDRMCQAASSHSDQVYDCSIFGRLSISESRRFNQALWAASDGIDLIAEFAEHVCGWKGNAARGEPPGTPG